MIVPRDVGHEVRIASDYLFYDKRATDPGFGGVSIRSHFVTRRVPDLQVASLSDEFNGPSNRCSAQSNNASTGRLAHLGRSAT